MKNSCLNLNEIFEIIKKGYISIFPYEVQGHPQMIITVLNNYCKNSLGIPLNVGLSNNYNNVRNPILAGHIEITEIMEETSKLSSQEKEKITDTLFTLRSNIAEIVEDIEALHKWLVQENLIRKNTSLNYFITKQFLELEKLPI